MKLFKSKAEKEMEARLAIKQGINNLKKYDRTLEKKKKEMIEHAQTAKEQGITQQYQVAVSGLKMILSYQKRCKAMILQIQMTESMRDLTTLSSNFVKIMGNVGKELTQVNKTANFANNQLAFEKGMMAAEAAMDQLESFMEDAGMSFADSQDAEELDAEIEALIDATGAAKVDVMDSEIDSLLAQIEKKSATMKE
ncbi:MAG: hypothetical protein Q4F41_00235 [Eubacteriales bacterium]|nr:hypothetical protein [Eubacteriales bacterium]